MYPRITQFPALEDILQTHPGWLDEAIDTGAVSKLTGIPSCTLTTWRCRGGGPPFMKLGSLVRYRRRRVLEWMHAREIERDVPPETDHG